MDGLDDAKARIDALANDHLYWRCVSVYAGSAGTIGALAGFGTPVTAAGGFLIGFVAGGMVGFQRCERIDPWLRSSALDPSRPMTEPDVRRLATQTARAYPKLSGQQVIELLIATRVEAARDPALYRC
ncbi:hypothetical protein Rumeso_02644 [Rubellimicrobium mesophilum DSM 19309]|uniref:Uncharacterized protein n=1 Tax=Rubellimicrobium mesophilum DSM 19309 TaxID=442562 RepID=A0A017HMZ7_9RHOB|nr:hypothetical protein [Rubellimicrobium mesophilum]EYD75862.1 hypothetical protein Rumeso_02644 [Rubellimicrobium mesophilum DSM 19309]